VKLRPLWWIGLGIVLFLIPEIVGGRHLGGTPLEAWTWPLWAWLHGRLVEGSLPLWNPYVDCGLSLVGTPAVGLCYPPHWLAWLFPPSTALPVDVGLHLLLAGYGMTRLLQHLGCRWQVASLAGLTVAVGGVLPALAGQPERLEVMAWWPWLLLATEDEHSMLPALVLGVQGLIGDPQGVLLSGAGAVVWMIARQPDPGATISRLGGLIPLGLLIGAAGWFPYAETYRHSLRWQGGVENPAHLGWHTLGGLFLVIPMTAIVLAVWARRDRLALQAGWAMVVLALVGARGMPGPLGWAWKFCMAQVPRVTDEPHSVVQVVWNVLGSGFAALSGDEPLRWLTVAGLSLLLLAGLGLERCFERGDQLGWSVALLHLLVCVVVGRWVLPTVTGPGMADPDQRALLKPIVGSDYRYVLAGDPDPRLYDDGTVDGARCAVGYAPMAPLDTMDVFNWAAHGRLVDQKGDLQDLLTNGNRVLGIPFNDAFLDTLSVKLLLEAKTPTGAVRLRTLEHTRDRLRLADHWTAYGRGQDAAFQLEDLPSPDDLNTQVLTSMAQSRPSNDVLLDQDPDDVAPDGPPVTGTATLSVDEPDRMVVQVEASRRALLVVGDAYDEGWQATVNGQAHRVYNADGMVRAVVVPQGRSEVVWTYAPPSWVVAWKVTLGSLLAWVFLSIREKRRLAVAAGPPRPASPPVPAAPSLVEEPAPPAAPPAQRAREKLPEDPPALPQ
jgi:hypothetical protein